MGIDPHRHLDRYLSLSEQQSSYRQRLGWRLRARTLRKLDTALRRTQRYGEMGQPALHRPVRGHYDTTRGHLGCGRRRKSRAAEAGTSYCIGRYSLGGRNGNRRRAD